MTDDTTTLTNPSVPGYGEPTHKEDTMFTDFTQIVSSVFNNRDKDKNRQTRKIRAELVRDYMSQPKSDDSSILQKIIGFLKG